MNKKELQKIYQDCVLKTNGGNDDYVVALLQIGNAIGELEENQEIAQLKAQVEEKDKEIKKLNKYISEQADTIIDYLDEAIIELQQKDQQIAQLKQENQQLKEKLENAIIFPYKINNYFLEHRNNKIFIYKYLGDLKFICLSHKQGYSSNATIIGNLICGDESEYIKSVIFQICEKDAQQTLEDLKNKN